MCLEFKIVCLSIKNENFHVLTFFVAGRKKKTSFSGWCGDLWKDLIPIILSGKVYSVLLLRTTGFEHKRWSTLKLSPPLPGLAMMLLPGETCGAGGGCSSGCGCLCPDGFQPVVSGPAGPGWPGWQTYNERKTTSQVPVMFHWPDILGVVKDTAPGGHANNQK